MLISPREKCETGTKNRQSEMRSTRRRGIFSLQGQTSKDDVSGPRIAETAYICQRTVPFTVKETVPDTGQLNKQDDGGYQAHSQPE